MERNRLLVIVLLSHCWYQVHPSMAINGYWPVNWTLLLARTCIIDRVHAREIAYRILHYWTNNEIWSAEKGSRKKERHPGNHLHQLGWNMKHNCVGK